MCSSDINRLRHHPRNNNTKWQLHQLQASDFVQDEKYDGKCRKHCFDLRSKKDVTLSVSLMPAWMWQKLRLRKYIMVAYATVAYCTAIVYYLMSE